MPSFVVTQKGSRKVEGGTPRASTAGGRLLPSGQLPCSAVWRNILVAGSSEPWPHFPSVSPDRPVHPGGPWTASRARPLQVSLPPAPLRPQALELFLTFVLYLTLLK